MRSLFNAVLDFLLPRQCIVCGRYLGLQEKHLCLHCQADLPLTRNWLMPHNPMADQFNALLEHMKPAPPMTPEPGAVPSEEFRACREISHEHEPYANAAALLFYRGDSPYSRIPQALKYGGNIAAGRYFAAMLGAWMAQQPHWQDVDAVIPVPLHWRRKHARGYNQAEIIAAELAKALGATLCPTALKRKRRTKSQTSLKAEDRLKNVSGVFAVNRLPAGARHLLLVDDTFTTGATLATCYEAVRSVIGPSTHISIATLAAVY
ncbi:MAG: ComF family protein [Bacteroidales bacterium]|nr:ComF family protein [Bacteroidales bacterium]